MTDPLFWLVLSFLFVTVSLTIVLLVAIPTLRELSRAARSAERLFDTLYREFPPTLESIRLTGMEISELTDDMSQGVQSAGKVVQQVDDSLSGVRHQTQRFRAETRSFLVGVRVAWQTFTKPRKATANRRSPDRLPPGAPLPFEPLEPPLDRTEADGDRWDNLYGTPTPEDRESFSRYPEPPTDYRE